MLARKTFTHARLLLAGYLHAVSLAWPFQLGIEAVGVVQGQALWWLQILSLAVLAHAQLQAGSVKQAAWRAWLFSTAWMLGSIWWLFISMHTYGGLPAWLAALAVVLLAGALALFYTLFSMLFRHVDGINTAYSAIIFAACWLLAELARGTWLTGFPWGASGYAHVDGPLAGLASTIGVYGMCFVAAYTAMLAVQLAGAWHQPKSVTQVKLSIAAPIKTPSFALRMQGLAVALLFLVLAMYDGTNVDADGKPVQSKQTQAPLTVTLLQGNIPQNEKFVAGTGLATALAWYEAQLLNSSSSLIVTPETALPLRVSQLEPAYWQRITERFTLTKEALQTTTTTPPATPQSAPQAALIGMVGSRPDGYTNAVLGLKPQAPNHAPLLHKKPYQYDKVHLVPFGEFFPPMARWFINMMNMPLGSFQRGEATQAPFAWQGELLGLNICYEDLFREELAQRFKEPSRAPTVLVNLTNLAWFGNTVAIDQHLNIARMRSKELARPSLRATNTGATVIIDAQGQVTHALPRHTRAALVGQVQGNSEITPYAWLASHFWLWPWYALAVLIVAAAYVTKAKRAT